MFCWVLCSVSAYLAFVCFFVHCVGVTHVPSHRIVSGKLSSKCAQCPGFVTHHILLTLLVVTFDPLLEHMPLLSHSPPATQSTQMLELLCMSQPWAGGVDGSPLESAHQAAMNQPGWRRLPFESEDSKSEHHRVPASIVSVIVSDLPTTSDRRLAAALMFPSLFCRFDDGSAIRIVTRAEAARHSHADPHVNILCDDLRHALLKLCSDDKQLTLLTCCDQNGIWCCAVDKSDQSDIPSSPLSSSAMRKRKRDST